LKSLKPHSWTDALINDPTKEELEQPYPCRSKKALKNCCHEKVLKTLRIMRDNQDPLHQACLASRGYQHWSDLMEFDSKAKDGQEKEWFPFLQPIDDVLVFCTKQLKVGIKFVFDFFRFWIEQIKVAIKWLKRTFFARRQGE
jgi:hypothetical protein